jgi:hypothetical protein
MAEGEARGRLEGEARGEAKLALRQLNLLCGPLSEATIARIQALPLEQLEALTEALLEFSGPADLAASGLAFRPRRLKSERCQGFSS